jgi:hypothetical protein
MRRPRTHHHSGQSLVTLAVFAFLLFVTMGLAIDGGLIYAQRRFMQNTADAACLTAANRLALGKTNTEADSAAELVIADNLGANAPGTLSYSSADQLYKPIDGSGVNLIRGIEISGRDVRVALQSPANTTFMRIAGIDTYTVAARARCNATAGGGAVPFAVARWRGYDSKGDLDTEGLSTDKALPQTGKKGTMTVHDVLRRDSSKVTTQWPVWGSANYPGDPATHTDLYSSPDASVVATEATPGEETVLAGNEARPNTGGNSFTGPIVLDYRQTTYAQPLFYNGLTPDSALSVYKDYATKYILGEYPGPSVIPGQELGYYSGVSAGLMEKPFDARYNVGDIVTMLVYNGTVYDSNKDADAFSMAYDTFTTHAVQKTSAGSAPSGYDCSLPNDYSYYDTSNAPTYKFSLTPLTYAPFELRAFLSQNPANWGNPEGTWINGSGSPDGPYALNINGSANSVSLDVSKHSIYFKLEPTDKVTCTATDPLNPTPTKDVLIRHDGAETIYLEAQNTAHSKRHGLYAFINNSASSSDFYAYFPQVDIAYQPFEPGGKASVAFNVDKANGTNGGPGTTLKLGSGPSVTAIDWFTTGLNSTCSGSTSNSSACNGVTVTLDKSGGGNKLDIDVSNSASTGKEYYVRFTISYSGYSHYAWYYIAVRPALNNSKSITEYVYALGYARFEITYVDSNTIKGKAVSGLLDPSTDASGLRPRLIPWEQ